jgi:hypothetical protein
MTVKTSLNFRQLWDQATSYHEFVREASANLDLWHGVYRTAKLPDWVRDRVAAMKRSARVIVLMEDWCWDAALTIPTLAKLADEAGCLEIRVLRRDEHPEVMDFFLTEGSRSIPIVIVLDDEFFERGHWGPRPAGLQEWAVEHKPIMAKEEWIREMRRQYACDRGESTLRELMEVLGSDRTP